MKHRVIWIGMVVAALSSLSLFTAASARAPAELVTEPLIGCNPGLDYVVLASFADSPHWLSLSNYRFQLRRTLTPTNGVQNVIYSLDRARIDCGIHRQQARQQNG